MTDGLNDDGHPSNPGGGHREYLEWLSKRRDSNPSPRPSGVFRLKSSPTTAPANHSPAPTSRPAKADPASDPIKVELVGDSTSGSDATNGSATGAVPSNADLPNVLAEPADHVTAAVGANAAAADDAQAALADSAKGRPVEMLVVSAEPDQVGHETGTAGHADAPAGEGAPEALELPRLFISATAVEATMGINDHRPIFGDFLYSGSVACLAGPPGCGKSLYMANIVAAVATGKTFAGDAVSRPHKAVVWAAEDGNAATLRRIYAAARVIGGDLNLIRENVVFVNRADELFLVARDASRGLAQTALAVDVFEQLKWIKPGVVAFDPMVEFNGLNENENGEMLYFMSALRKVARDNACAVLSVHHAVKAKEPRTTLASIRGAGSIGGAIRSARGVSEMTKDDCAGPNLASGDARDAFRVDDIKNSYARRGNEGRFFVRETVQEHGIDTPIIRQIFKEKGDNK